MNVRTEKKVLKTIIPKSHYPESLGYWDNGTIEKTNIFLMKI
jgi:hypothetical protein